MRTEKIARTLLTVLMVVCAAIGGYTLRGQVERMTNQPYTALVADEAGVLVEDANTPFPTVLAAPIVTPPATNKPEDLLKIEAQSLALATPVKTETENVPVVEVTAPPSATTVPEIITPKMGKININTANQAELETLPGIGPVKAAAIIAFRESYGAFTSIDQITRVSGIGEKTFEKLRGMITTD